MILRCPITLTQGTWGYLGSNCLFVLSSIFLTYSPIVCKRMTQESNMVILQGVERKSSGVCILYIGRELHQ